MQQFGIKSQREYMRKKKTTGRAFQSDQGWEPINIDGTVDKLN